MLTILVGKKGEQKGEKGEKKKRCTIIRIQLSEEWGGNLEGAHLFHFEIFA